MSYILDALKKAESERNLGNVPHLHAQPALEAAAPSQRNITRIAIVLALVLLTACVTLLLWLQPWQKQEVYTVTVTTAPARASPLPGFSTPAVMSSAPAAAPIRKPVADKPADAPHAVTAATPATIAETDPTALEQVPEALRRELPALTVNGYILADKPADRSVLVNNKLLREGESVTPELKLEKITAHGLILNFRSYRYRSAY